MGLIVLCSTYWFYAKMPAFFDKLQILCPSEHTYILWAHNYIVHTPGHYTRYKNKKEKNSWVNLVEIAWRFCMIIFYHSLTVTAKKKKKEVKISTAYKLGKNVLCTLLAARPAFRMLLVIGALIKLNNKLVGFAFIPHQKLLSLPCELQMLNCGIHCTDLGI